MRVSPFITGVLALCVATLPSFAGAQTLTNAVGLFNILVGLMLVAGFLAYGAGFIVWVTRLGSWPTYRTQGVHIMEWGVVILFVLVVLLAIVQFFQAHPRAGGYVLAIIVLLVVIGVIVFLATRPSDREGEDKKEEGGGAEGR